MAIDLTGKLLTAQGINAELVRTWNPELHREKRLLVPIQVDALPVRVEGGTWADCLMASPDSVDDEEPRSIDLLPPPFTDREESRSRGVHLHWAMPDGLLQLDATEDPENEPTPPPLPDRWLVVRLSSAPGDVRRRRAAWVLDARSGGGPVRLSDWREATPTGLPITGLGTGDPGWSTYYDNTEGRFTFYDDLEGVSGSVSYLVCGWYGKDDEDPIGGAGIRTWEGFHARLAELGWEADEIQPEDDDEGDARQRASEVAAAKRGLRQRHVTLDDQGKVLRRSAALLDEKRRPIGEVYRAFERGWPEQVMLHGSVVGIGWPNPLADDEGAEGEVGGPPRAEDIRVVFAPSGPEALGAVVADESGRARDADATAALAMGTVPELDDESALARLDESLHRAAFDSVKADDGTTERIWQGPATGPYRLPDPPRRSNGGSRVQTPRASSKKGAAKQGARRPTKDDPTVKGGLSIRDFLKRREVRGDDEAEGEWITVRRPGPRWYRPADPVLLVQGARRSLKHGGDGRFGEDGRLPCRLSDRAVRSLSVHPTRAERPRVLILGEDVLDRPLNHGSLPPACDELLREVVLLDPGSAPVIAGKVLQRSGGDGDQTLLARQSRDVVAEQTAWWSTFDPRVERSGVIALSGLEGTAPCPLAVRPSNLPWVPLHLDWEVEYIPSAERTRDWTLDEIDYVPDGPGPEEPDDVVRLSGRCLLDAGLADATARTIRAAHEQASRAGGTVDLVPGVPILFQSVFAGKVLDYFGSIDTGDDLADIAETLEDMDVLSGALEHFHDRLRQSVSDEDPLADDATVPDEFVPLRAGMLRLRRCRLVDGFGQVLWLAGSGPESTVQAGELIVPENETVPDAPGLMAAPPRFTAPSRLWFRWVRPDDPSADATPDEAPVCGWVLPDHLDGALEFFDADGKALGQLCLDPTVGAAWELAPGRPSTVGGTPAAAMGQDQLAGIAQALVERGLEDVDEDPGRETALAALLRVIDSTLWTVDPYGHVGEEHLSLLIGHPVAVLRAVVRVEVSEPVQDVGNEQVAVPIRLGALTHWQDGLFGYFVDDDYHAFRCVRPEAAELALDAPKDGFLGSIHESRTYYQRFLDDLAGDTHPGSPVVHPYIDRDGILWAVPGQTHTLTLLVEPHCVVHATTGFLPRKEIGLRREWIEDALKTIAPTFRYGPVLRDPREVRMPIAADVGGSWTWTHRQDVDLWAEEPVTHDAGDALLPPDPARAEEGWLRLTPDQPEDASDG